MPVVELTMRINKNFRPILIAAVLTFDTGTGQLWDGWPCQLVERRFRATQYVTFTFNVAVVERATRVLLTPAGTVKLQNQSPHPCNLWENTGLSNDVFHA